MIGVTGDKRNGIFFFRFQSGIKAREEKVNKVIVTEERSGAIAEEKKRKVNKERKYIFDTFIVIKLLHTKYTLHITKIGRD